MREYRTLKALRAGEVVDLNGVRVRMDVDADGKERPVAPGDLYVAERNTGPHLLTALKIHPRGWIQPTTWDYSFDTCECVKVVEA